jgi:hypothetical protein
MDILTQEKVLSLDAFRTLICTEYANDAMALSYLFSKYCCWRDDIERLLAHCNHLEELTLASWFPSQKHLFLMASINIRNSRSFAIITSKLPGCDNLRPFAFAGERGSAENCHVLIDNQKDRKQFACGLMMRAAIECGRLSIVKAIACKMNLLAKTDDFGSFVHLASAYGHLDIVVFLCQTLDPMQPGPAGWNALDFAIHRGHLHIAKWFCKTYQSLNSIACNWAADRLRDMLFSRQPVHFAWGPVAQTSAKLEWLCQRIVERAIDHVPFEIYAETKCTMALHAQLLVFLQSSCVVELVFAYVDSWSSCLD